MLHHNLVLAGTPGASALPASSPLRAHGSAQHIACNSQATTPSQNQASCALCALWSSCVLPGMQFMCADAKLGMQILAKLIFAVLGCTAVPEEGGSGGGSGSAHGQPPGRHVGLSPLGTHWPSPALQRSASQGCPVRIPTHSGAVWVHWQGAVITPGV